MALSKTRGVSEMSAPSSDAWKAELRSDGWRYTIVRYKARPVPVSPEKGYRPPKVPVRYHPVTRVYSWGFVEPATQHSIDD